MACALLLSEQRGDCSECIHPMAIARLERNGQYRHLIELNDVKVPFVPMALIRHYTLYSAELQNCGLVEVSTPTSVGRAVTGSGLLQHTGAS
jgi:hypothetical protein